MRTLLSICLFALLCFLTSCGLSSLFGLTEGEWDVSNYKGEWTVPLGKATRELDSLFTTIETSKFELVDDENGDLVYRHESKKEAELPEGLTQLGGVKKTFFHRQNDPLEYEVMALLHPGERSISIPLSEETNLAFPAVAGTQLHHIVFKEAKLVVEWQNNFTANTKITLELPGLKKQTNEEVFRREFTFPKRGSTGDPPRRQRYELSLAGYRLEFYPLPDRNPDENFFKTKLSGNITLNPGDEVAAGTTIRVDLTFDIKELLRLHGYFGNRKWLLFEDGAAIFKTVEETDYSQIRFGDPSITITVTQPQGIPMQLDTDQISFIALDGQKFPLKYEGNRNIDYPNTEQIGQSKQSAVRIDETNSNIAIALKESGAHVVSIPLLAEFNPSLPAPQDKRNYFRPSEKIVSHVRIDLPVLFVLENFEKRFSYNITEMYRKRMENVKKVEINLIAENQYPFGGVIFLSFLNAQGEVFFVSEEKALFESAELDDEGNVVKASSSSHTLKVQQEALESLKRTYNIRFTVRANTPIRDGERVEVRMKRNQTITVQAGLRAGGEVDFSEEIENNPNVQLPGN